VKRGLQNFSKPKPRGTTEVARYDLPFKGTSLVITRGSVLDFKGAAIVNAANMGCLGGGGVDGAISRAGGLNLERDRCNLPVLAEECGMPIRCKVGMAVLTGPNDYGDLPPYIIHAVGPNFLQYQEADIEEGVKLLKSAYSSALDIAINNQVGRVGFSLLSAGVFRGPLPLTEILSTAIEAIRDWAKLMIKSHEERGVGFMCVKEIHLCAFTGQECSALKEVCDHLLPYQSQR
jgi:O-acetyl-ADP-ribose deacetylase (regulator of RNase III)